MLEQTELDGDVRDIVLYPDDVLTTPAEEVEDYERAEAIIADLIATLERYGGQGLSAPQIGIPKRIAVIQPKSDPSVPRTVVNPEIVDEEGTQKSREGCLSIPGVEGELERSERVTIRTDTLDGGTETFTEDDWTSVIFQHEIDHLDGVVIFDRMTPTRRRMCLKDYRKMRRKASREGVDLLEMRRRIEDGPQAEDEPVEIRGIET